MKIILLGQILFEKKLRHIKTKEMIIMISRIWIVCGMEKGEERFGLIEKTIGMSVFIDKRN